MSDGIRVFAYCRTGPTISMGSMFRGPGRQSMLWDMDGLPELRFRSARNMFTVSLAPFQVRVFAT